MSGVKPFLIVAGLRKEARAAGAGRVCVLSGADGATLRARLGALDPRSYAGVVSFGLAGGLDPALAPGDLVIGARAVAPGALYDAAPAFVDHLAAGARAAGLAFICGAVAGVDALAMTPAAKAALRARTRADVVDMESHIAGDFAARARLPFAMVRVVCDPAERALPPAAARAITPAGAVALAVVLREVARAPASLGALARAARDSRAAFKTLKACAPLF